MKTDKIMIGDLARCVNFEKERKYEPETFYSECQDGHLRISTSTLNYKTLKENVLFIENAQGQLVHHFRKYSKVPSAEGEIYAENLKRFDYQNLRSKEEINYFKLQLLYHKYINEIIKVSNLYTADIVIDTPYNDVIKKFLGKKLDKQEIVVKDDLVLKINDNTFYSYSLDDYLNKSPQSNKKEYVDNIRLLEIDEINNKWQEYMPESEIIDIYKRSLKK
ncbi:MAG TPA: hypothetical protein OIM63_05585 [Bacilli bacterium]|nr:hypothetical protein [Bacilli bacterium]